MSAELKRLLATALVSAALGAGSTFVFVWRDMAVVKAELGHIREDLSLVQTFIASDDPKAWMAAKATIQKHHERDK